MWHSYFRPATASRPFERLGAALVLENLAGGEASTGVEKALAAPYLTPENTRFLVLHRHEAVPHGEQVMDALLKADLTEAHHQSVMRGARIATLLYLRMAEWAINESAEAGLIPELGHISDSQLAEIADFDVRELSEPPV